MHYIFRNGGVVQFDSVMYHATPTEARVDQTSAVLNPEGTWLYSTDFSMHKQWFEFINQHWSRREKDQAPEEHKLQLLLLGVET